MDKKYLIGFIAALVVIALTFVIYSFITGGQTGKGRVQPVQPVQPVNPINPQ